MWDNMCARVMIPDSKTEEGSPVIIEALYTHVINYDSLKDIINVHAINVDNFNIILKASEDSEDTINFTNIPKECVIDTMQACTHLYSIIYDKILHAGVNYEKN